MRILVATGPYAGHTLPMERLVRTLVASGHAVTWYVDSLAAERATSAGAAVVPLPDDIAAILAGVSGWKMHGPAPALLDECVQRFLMTAPAVRQDLAGREADFDVVVADPIMLGAHRFARAAAVPLVTVGVVPAIYVDPDVDLHLQCCVPSLEYFRPDLPQMRCIGPLLPMPVAWEPPDWWETLPTNKPLIVVAQGTVATEADALAKPALDALLGLPELEGVILSPTLDPVTSAVPPWVHVLPWAPYPEVLIRAGAFVTNGGYAGVNTAVTLGRPVIVTGETEDKPEVGARVAWAGVGIDLTQTPTTSIALTQALKTMAQTPRYFERAQELARRTADYDAPALATAMIEQVVADRLNGKHGEVAA